MKNFDTRVYNISDFSEWNSTGLLELSPEFQRRSVWSERAKSYLIDTIVRGKPIPKILITQNLRQSRNIRVVVDGQQRLRAILEYMDDAFRISRAHNKEFAGMRFSNLHEDIQNDFRKYEIGVDVLFDLDYPSVLDIFARLNTYSVKLNPQEKLNAEFLGYFKQTAYRLGYRYVNYWIEADIMSKQQVSRMSEAELASDLLVAFIAGVQSSKVIQTYYKNFEDDPGNLETVEDDFDQVMSFIGELYPAQEIKKTNYKRSPLFYSLFCCIAHGLHGLSNLDKVPRPPLTIKNISRARVRLDEISSRYDANDPSQDYQDFIDATQRATTDISRRVLRASFLCRKLDEALRD
jgi:Protein of unknown function DUF262